MSFFTMAFSFQNIGNRNLPNIPILYYLWIAILRKDKVVLSPCNLFYLTRIVKMIYIHNFPKSESKCIILGWHLHSVHPFKFHRQYFLRYPHLVRFNLLIIRSNLIRRTNITKATPTTVTTRSHIVTWRQQST